MLRREALWQPHVGQYHIDQCQAGGKQVGRGGRKMGQQTANARSQGESKSKRGADETHDIGTLLRLGNVS